MELPDDSIPRPTLAKMVQCIDPTWDLRDASRAPGGYLPVHVLDVATPTGPRRAVVKASPDGERHGIDLEARMLRILEAHTAIPVPAVQGAVDAHGDLPSPFVCMDFVPGRTVERSELDTVSTTTLAALSRASGRYLAALHALDAVDAYGFLQRDPDTTLRGGRPPTTLDQVVVGDPEPSWPTCLREWAGETLSMTAETDFADLVPELRPVLASRIDDLQGPFRPVIGHIDNSLENVRFDPETAEIRAMVDWAFSLAVTPAYDLVLVESSLRGGQWRFVPGSPDPVEVVRPALLDGYRSAGSTAVLDRLAANRDCYELLSLCRSTHLLDVWPAVQGASPEQEAGAATAVRDALEAAI